MHIDDIDATYITSEEIGHKCSLYCFECGEYVFDNDIELLILSETSNFKTTNIVRGMGK
jgi:hypothetical protein